MDNYVTTPQILLAFIAVLPGTLLALATLITSLRNTSKLTNVHDAVNGRMSELLKTSTDAAEAKGLLKGKELTP